MFQARSVAHIFSEHQLSSHFQCVFYSAIQIDLYSLYRKKVTTAFKLNEKSLDHGACFQEKKWWFVSCKPSRLAKVTILYDCVVYIFTVEMCNAILRNNLNLSLFQQPKFIPEFIRLVCQYTFFVQIID